MVKELQRLSSGSYRIAQEDSGAPVVQFLDSAGQEWVDVATAPRAHWRAVEAELVLQAANARRLAEQLAEAEEAKKKLAMENHMMLTDLKQAQGERDYLAVHARARKIGKSISAWRFQGEAA